MPPPGLERPGAPTVCHWWPCTCSWIHLGLGRSRRLPIGRLDRALTKKSLLVSNPAPSPCVNSTDGEIGRAPQTRARKFSCLRRSSSVCPATGSLTAARITWSTDTLDAKLWTSEASSIRCPQGSGVARQTGPGERPSPSGFASSAQTPSSTSSLDCGYRRQAYSLVGERVGGEW